MLLAGTRPLLAQQASPLRITAGDTPTIELFQNTTAGFAQYEWNVYANEFGFHVADVNSFSVPFLVESMAADDSLVVKANGSVGIGTALANNIGAVTGVGKFLNLRAGGTSGATGIANLVVQGQLNSQMHLVHNGAPANQRILRLQCANGLATFNVVNDNLTSFRIPNALAISMNTGYIGLRQPNPTHPLHLISGAHCTQGGVWTNASSRDLKDDIQPITSGEAEAAFAALQPVAYRYKNEPTEKYCGFIAEDVPELVATGDRKGLGSMDIVAVLTKVVQDQRVEMQNQGAVVRQQQKLLDDQRQTLEAQQALLTKLTQRLGEIERRTGASSSQP